MNKKNESSPNYEKKDRKQMGSTCLSVRGKNMLFQGLWTLTFFMLLNYFVKSWDKVSCILDWPWTCYITEDDLELLRIIHPSILQSAGTEGITSMTNLMWCWGLNPEFCACLGIILPTVLHTQFVSHASIIFHIKHLHF